VIVDDYTRYTWVVFLVDTSDMFATFKSFIKRIHNEFKTTIKRVRSDNGSEFKNTRSYMVTLELDINSWSSTLHNQIGLLRERIEHLVILE